MSTDPALLVCADRHGAESGGRRLLRPVLARPHAPERLEEGAEAGREAALHPRADRRGTWVHCSGGAASGVFAEVAGIAEVLLHSPVHGEHGQALKEHAALWLNLASGRLYATTAVNLPELTRRKPSATSLIGISRASWHRRRQSRRRKTPARAEARRGGEQREGARLRADRGLRPRVGNLSRRLGRVQAAARRRLVDLGTDASG